MNMKKRKTKHIIIFFSLLIVFSLSYVLLYKTTIKLNHPYPANRITKFVKPNSCKDSVYIGVISRFTPEKIYKGYQPIMDYLTEQTGLCFGLKLGSTYSETIEMLKEGKVEAAFAGTFIFIKENKGDLFAVLKPLNSNLMPFFRSVLITKNSSSIDSISDLRNKKIALPSPEAFSSFWFKNIFLKKHQMSLNDLKKITYFGYHNSVVRQVLMGIYDAGVVKGRVANEYKDKGIKIVAYSFPFPGSPIIISEKSNPRIVKLIVTSLLNSTTQIRKSWDKEFLFGFVKASNKDYDILKNIIKENK